MKDSRVGTYALVGMSLALQVRPASNRLWVFVPDFAVTAYMARHGGSGGRIAPPVPWMASVVRDSCACADNEIR